MTTTHALSAVMQKLMAIRALLSGCDTNKHPKRVLRFMLQSPLFITKAEILAAFGVAELSELPTKTLQGAVNIMTRIESGKDSFGTITEKAQVLIKAIHPRYVAELKRAALETSRKAAREALEKRFATLSGGKALPDGTSDELLMKLVSDLRSDLEDKTRELMTEVNEPALRHPDVGRTTDGRLVELKLWLDARYKELHTVRPRPYRLFAQEFAEQLAATQ